jgi:hypothetical protein
LRVSSVARARCSALFTAARLMSSASAVSAADQLSTCVSSSTARWRGGRYCSAATNASRMLSRRIARSSGVCASSAGSASLSGIGSTHVSRLRCGSAMSGFTSPGVSDTSSGRMRVRFVLLSASRQTFVAMR